MNEKSSNNFSYLIRPVTPCIFDSRLDDHDDDEFFLTTGGIIYSCPNIYELSISSQFDYRKLQSCDHLKPADVRPSIDNLNVYDREFSRYSIAPRFRTNNISYRSIGSEIEFDENRQLTGLSRLDSTTKSIYSSRAPISCRSENYLFFLHVVSQSKKCQFPQRSRSNHFSMKISPSLQFVPLVAQFSVNQRDRSFTQN